MQEPKLKKISSFFDKYKQTLVAPESSVKKEVCEVIKDVMQVEVNESQISYTVSTKVVALNVPSVLKSEILQHKRTLLVHLKGRLGAKNAPQTIL